MHVCVVCANLFLTQCKGKVTSSLFFCKGKRIGEVCVAGEEEEEEEEQLLAHLVGRGRMGQRKKNTITETWHQWGKKKRLQTSNIPFFPFICYMTKVRFARRMAPKTLFMSRGQEERETVMSTTDERG